MKNSFYEKNNFKRNGLKTLLSEYVYNALKNTTLLEYLIHRNKFVELCWSLSQQILENWCLIRYCTLTNRNETKEHWKNELLTYLHRIDINGIKANNSPKNRIKAIKEGFDMADLFDINSKIYKSVYRKFKLEGINDDSTIELVIIDFYKSINNLITTLANGNSIDSYVDNI